MGKFDAANFVRAIIGMVIGGIVGAAFMYSSKAEAQAHKQFTDSANGVVCYIYSSNISCVKVR